MKNDNPQQADIAYAAGLFDGEGSIAAYVGGGTKRDSLIYAVSIWQSSLPVLEWFSANFGGGVYRRENAGYGKASNKSTAEWRVTQTNAYAFLQLIRPYLKIRHEDIDGMLRIWEQRSDKEQLVQRCETFKEERGQRRAAATTK